MEYKATMKRYEAHKHTVGRTRSAEYLAWLNMIQRCTNKNRPDYAQYGGRGITVSDKKISKCRTPAQQD